MEEDSEEGSHLREDYYTFLNLSKDATDEEITNAYRRFSKLYHPDKHIEPERKKEAEVLFNKTKKAYEVLKDPHKRAIYDSVGVKGLETEGWEIIQRTKTPDEIREEYERLARQREERRLLQRTNPKGNVTVNINATDLFNRYGYYYDDDYDLEDGNIFPSIEVSGMSLSQSIESPLTSRDTATMSGHLSTHNGTGSGGITLSNKRNLGDKAWAEIMAGAGQGPMLAVKGYRSLTSRVFTTGQATLHFPPSGGRSARGSLEATLGMQLAREVMGYLSWRSGGPIGGGSGSNSGMSTTLIKESEFWGTSCTLLLGVPHSFLALSYTRKLKERQLRLKVAIKAGTFGGMLEYSAEKKVSEQSTISAAMSLGVPTGVMLRIKLTRASQTYLFPIHLCEEVMPSAVFYGTVVPLLTWLLVKRFIIDPIDKEKSERGKKRQRDKYMNRMEEKRREAEAAITLMSVKFGRVRAEEEGKMGLVIITAKYGPKEGNGTNQNQQRSSGSASSSTSSTPSSTSGGGVPPTMAPFIDVTVPLQCLVIDSKLVIHESTKSQLPGFYDPCPGEEKILEVQYLFHNQMHQIVVSDNERLTIPRRSHRVAPS